MEMGRTVARTRDDQARLLAMAYEDQIRIAKKLHPRRRYRTHELHAFCPREHIGEGWFIVALDPQGDRRARLDADDIFTRNMHMASAFNSRLKLPPPFPSFPRGPKSNFGLYIRHGDSRLSFFNFHSAYAARHALDTMIAGREYRWLNDDEIHVDELRIRGEAPGQLDAIIEHRMRDDELEWEMPEPYNSWFRTLAGEARERMSSPIPTVAPTPTKRRERTPDAPPIARAPRTAGAISIADIADELGTEPRIARGVLRKLKIDKPASGRWEWSAGEAERIRERIRDALRT